MTLDLNNADSACAAMRQRIGIDYQSPCPICVNGPCHWHAPSVPLIADDEVERVAQCYSAALGEDPFEVVKASSASSSTTEPRWRQHVPEARKALAMRVALKAHDVTR